MGEYCSGSVSIVYKAEGIMAVRQAAQPRRACTQAQPSNGQQDAG
jgi:hypothetical protein